MKKLNNKGVALITAYFVMFILMALSVSLALSTVTELNNARRYRDSTAAFWLAEAGVSRLLRHHTMLEGHNFLSVVYGNGTIEFRKNDAHPSVRVVTLTGIANGVKRSIQLEYPANVPDIFNRTLSVGGNIDIKGAKSTLMVNGKLRLSGRVKDTSKHSILFMEDKRENVNVNSVTLNYPDADKNGRADEFSDFVAVNRDLIAGYPKEEVVYIQGSDTYTIVPNQALADKKIIFVEGREGKGDVVVQFDGAWAPNQNITIIATGTVTYNQAGLEGQNSKVNIIAWGDYFETAVLPSSHNGLIYTHGTAHFDEIHDASVTNGCVIANKGIVINEVWSNKTFNYSDPRVDGVLPPGFEGLLKNNWFGYSSVPSSWKEI